MGVIVVRWTQFNPRAESGKIGAQTFGLFFSFFTGDFHGLKGFFYHTFLEKAGIFNFAGNAGVLALAGKLVPRTDINTEIPLYQILTKQYLPPLPLDC